MKQYNLKFSREMEIHYRKERKRSVEKFKNLLSHWKIIASNHLFSTNFAFTEFLQKKKGVSGVSKFL